MASRANANDMDPTGEALDFAEKRARVYLREAGRRKVYPSDAALRALARFREAFPDLPSKALDVLRMLDELGSPATVLTTGGRYFGFVIGGSLPASLAASRLVSTWDQNAAFRVMSPVAAEIEEVVLGWMCSAFGLNEDCEGGLVTDATAANFTALAAARQALLARSGWDVAADGMFGAPPIEVVVGEEVHASVLKALNLAGFGQKRVTVVPADEQGRMRADRLPKIKKNSLVCIQAGNVNTGCFDPANEVCRWAH